MKKWVSYTIDGILGVGVAFLAYCAISMMITMNKPENYGVPSVFGHSILYVVTDSMAADTSTEKSAEQEAEEERVGTSYPIGHIEPGEGAIIKKVDASTIKVGDIISFYYEQLQALDTHRVMEIDLPSETTSQKYVFHTRGDNLHSQFGNWSVSYRDDPVTEDSVVGVVTSHSAFLGTVLKFVSPAVPNGYATWFIPTLVIIPLSVIAGLTVADSVKQLKKEKKEINAEIDAAMIAAGADPKDEAERLKFEEKVTYKHEIREEMEKEKAKEKARLAKQAKRGKNIEAEPEAKPVDAEKEAEKRKAIEEEKARIKAEMKAQMKKEMAEGKTPETKPAEPQADSPEEAKRKAIEEEKEKLKAEMKAQMKKEMAEGKTPEAQPVASDKEAEKRKAIEEEKARIKAEMKAQMKKEMAEQKEKSAPSKEEEKRKAIEEEKERIKAEMRAQMMKEKEDKK